jgi:hypothetical protein
MLTILRNAFLEKPLYLFKTEYAYYGRDLLDMMESRFPEYLYTFLHDERLPYLAETVNLGLITCKLYDLGARFQKMPVYFVYP